MIPKRIQRKRTKGWKAPEGAVYGGRPSKWGNRFVVAPERDPEGFYEYRNNVDLWDKWPCPDAQTAVAAFREMQIPMYTAEELEELRGKDIMCWCGLDQPCHVDVLIDVANAPQSGGAREKGRAA